jgi:chemotaxis protein methyltransferase CheR
LTGTLAPAVAARVRWQRHDLSADPRPAGQWSLILCRNVAIHLSPAHRERVHATLAASLCSGGVLLLGRSESIHARHGLVKIAPNSYRRVR